MIDPARAAPAELWPPIPFNLVAEATLHLGDRVELEGTLEATPVRGRSAERVPYRAAPDTFLTAAGLLTLRRVA